MLAMASCLTHRVVLIASKLRSYRKLFLPVATGCGVLLLALQRMKIPLANFHYSRHDLSVRDKACLCAKVTFMWFENQVTK